MKRGNWIVKLVFGCMGIIYAIVGVICLTIAVKWAGDIRRIFRLPENDLALSIVGTVFTALGVVFLLVTAILFLADVRRNRLREELLRYGTRVTGRITDVRVDHTIRVNHRSPLIAKVTCTLPSGEVTLKSPRLWSVCPNPGDQVDVLYDPMDEKRYVIEFEGGK